MAATSPQPASLTAQGNAGLHLSHSAASTICPFQRWTALSLEKQHLWADCHAVVAWIQASPIVCLLEHGCLMNRRICHTLFPELLQFNSVYSSYTFL